MIGCTEVSVGHPIFLTGAESRCSSHRLFVAFDLSRLVRRCLRCGYPDLDEENDE